MDNKSKEKNDLCDLVIKSSNSVLNINNIKSNTNKKKREYKHETISKDSSAIRKIKISYSTSSINGRNNSQKFLQSPSNNNSKTSQNNDDLLIIQGCSKNNSSSSLPKPKKLPSSSFSKSKLFQCRKNYSQRYINRENMSQKTDESKNYTNEEFYTPQNQSVKIMPFQLAGTIYTELCRQKSIFFNKIKQDSKVSKFYDLNHNSIDKNKMYNKMDNIHTTCLLDRKLINEIPVTVPIYLSHNIHYDSISEKNRHEKIAQLLIKLKTYIAKDPENDLATVKEFMLKHGIYNHEYYELEKLNNIILFLNHSLTIDPKKTLGDIIKEAANYQPSEQDLLDIKEGKGMNKTDICKISVNTIKAERNNDNKDHSKTSSINFYNKDKMLNIDEEKFYEKVKREYKPKELKELVKGLEEEFVNIQKEKIEKIEKNNNIWNPQVNHNEKPFVLDNNQFVPNLCLSSKIVNKGLMKKIQQHNEKLLKKMNKQQKIREINQRMYYSSILKENSVDLEEIKRRNKLTEFIILERAKKQLALEHEKQKLELSKNIV